MNCIEIIRSNFIRRFSKKTAFIISLIIPVIVVIIGILANIVSKPSFLIGFIDNSPTKETNEIIQMLDSTDGIDVRQANQASQKTDIITGYYSAVIEFKNDDFIISSVKAQKTVDKLAQIVNYYKAHASVISSDEIFGNSLGIPQRICAFILLFLMITATINASLINKDKNNKILLRIKVSPCPAASYILGNVIYNILITYVQYLIAVTVIQMFNIDMSIGYLNYLLMGVWITLFAASFGTCMSSIFKREMHVNMFASCIALTLSLIGGTFIAFDKMPPILQDISVISPVRWFIESVNSMENGKSWFDSTNSIIIITIFIILLFIIALIKNKHQKVF